jgi:hypothetical protein
MSADTVTEPGDTEACAQPAAPAVSGAANGNNITWNWSGGGGNTLTFTYYLCVDGGCSNEGANPGSVTDSYACGQTHSAYAYVIDSQGTQSTDSATASATTAACVVTQPPPTQSINIAWGQNPAPSGNYMNITFNNFPTGTVTWYCVEEGTSYGPYHTDLTSSTQTLTTNTCYDTEAGGTDYVTSDGILSNTIRTD